MILNPVMHDFKILRRESQDPKNNYHTMRQKLGTAPLKVAWSPVEITQTP